MTPQKFVAKWGFLREDKLGSEKDNEPRMIKILKRLNKEMLKDLEEIIKTNMTKKVIIWEHTTFKDIPEQDNLLHDPKKIAMIKLQIHPDGVWWTSEYEYKGRKILIKAKNGHGVKAHVFYPNSEKVQFTLRYNFMIPSDLLKKVQVKIDLKEEKNNEIH